MGAIEPMIRYFLVTSLVIYLAFRAWKGVAKVKENVTGIAFEKIPQANVFKHPLYTFCPDFDASVIPLRKGKITPKTTLRQMTRDTIKPHNFIVSVSDGDGKQPYADSWSKSYRITSDFRDRENKTFAPCFTYDNPNEYMMGKNNATLRFVIKVGTEGGIVNDISLSLHDRHGHIDSLYPSITGRKSVTLPSHRREDDPSKETSRIVRIQFETNLNEKISSLNWPCQKDLTDDYCLERVVERESGCYLPWGRGLAADKSLWCHDALSLDTVLRHMPEERTMSKKKLIDHIKSLGCTVSCTYIAYNPIINYDKYFNETNPGLGKNLYLNISPKNKDRSFLKEFYVYDWTAFFSDMGSYIGLLLGWSFLSILEMIIDFLDILIRKKLTVKELNNVANAHTGDKAGLVRTLSLNTIPEVTASPIHTIMEDALGEEFSEPYY